MFFLSGWFMERSHLIFGIVLAFLLIVSSGVMLAPYLAFSGDEASATLYDIYSLTCHQKLSRSVCLFQGEGLYVADCTPQEGEKVERDQEIIRAERDGDAGYKLAVCARDVGLYFAMLLGVLVYPLVRRLDDTSIYPPIILVLAIIPFALDGTFQFLSGLVPGVFGDYESTNAIRLASGAIAGFVAAFYIIPILNNMFSPLPPAKVKQVRSR